MAGPVKRYDVAQIVLEARLKTPAILLTNFPKDPSAEFKIDPPEIWSDEIGEAASLGRMTVMSRLLLGDQYEAFIAAGGSNSVINLVLGEHAGGLSLGKSSDSDNS